jgi:hypothetical protein
VREEPIMIANKLSYLFMAVGAGGLGLRFAYC